MTTNDLIKTVIDPGMLDRVGRQFKFQHGKGISEWLKNSLDEYLRRVSRGEESLASSWPVYIVAADTSKGAHLSVIDFGGATHEDMEKFLLVWFKEDAATHGGLRADAGVTGGMGNGGKFYMREMWEADSSMVTFRSGRQTGLKVQKRTDGNTGRWLGRDEESDWRTALALGLKGVARPEGIVKIIADQDPEIISELDSGSRGLTIVTGFKARQLLSTNDVVAGKKWKLEKLADAIRDSRGSYRPLRELSVRVIHNGALRLEELLPEPVEMDLAWDVEKSGSWEVPSRVPDPSAPGELIELEATDDPAGELTIFKAAHPLQGKLRERNRVTALDSDDNPIWSWPLRALGVRNIDHSRALLGELNLTFDSVLDMVQNDRESPVESDPRTNALRHWVSQRINEVTAEIEKEIKARATRRALDKVAELNEELQSYAQKFLEKLDAETFIDWLDEPGSGDTGVRGGSGKKSGDGTGGGNPRGGGKLTKEGTEQKVRRSRWPKILLSGKDVDPRTGVPKFLSDSHPPVYQDESDRELNIWWINLQHPYTEELLERGGGEGGPAWIQHHMSMFHQVVQYEHMRMLYRRDSDMPA